MLKNKKLIWLMGGVLLVLIAIAGVFSNTPQQTDSVEKLVQECAKLENDHLVNRCFTDMGASFMELTNFNIDQSIDICNRINVGEDVHLLRSCIEGIFISTYSSPDVLAQVFPGDTSDIDLIKDFCSKYDSVARDLCFSEAFPLLGDMVMDQGVVIDFCSQIQERDFQYFCYETLHMISSEMYANDVGATQSDFVNYCLEVPREYQRNCLDSGISKLLQVDLDFLPKVLQICEFGRVRLPGYSCAVAVSIYFPESHFNDDPDGRNRYCNRLPNSLKSLCLENKSMDDVL